MIAFYQIIIKFLNVCTLYFIKLHISETFFYA